ncbi:hypothetical protein [Parabacteroides goldsteinii]|nr:hypothetical protein [Parabacteroides goldsteinii]
MKTFYKLGSMLLCSAFLLCNCTKENPTDGDGTQPGGTPGEVREVMVTLKNQLVLQKGATKATGAGSVATKAEAPIATAAENAISTLDVYVFGAKTENGDYTFQERFAYRADSKDRLPQGATELLLNAGSDGKETTALIKLKKGLFVKLYCIANDTTLVDPATDKVVKAADFTPITFTESEDGTPRFAAEGKPQESTFVGWHTRLLTAAVKADTLATPLAMAGACTTPIDLTSFDNSARVQVGFRLTRLVARFDINNKAGDSRFTIETVSMGNGRRGSGLFPIRVYGNLPEAEPDQLITYPVHAFYGDNANNGLCTGAFYAYPSPRQDKAFLILNGKYKVNETEMKNVSYQIPFTQPTADGNTAWLDIANNHRYTIAVTKADAYHLDANILVTDWADDGSIEYTPDNKPGEIVVTIPEAFKGDSEYDEEMKIVNMSLKEGSSFEITTTSTSALALTKVYAGNTAARQFDWLDVSEPETTIRAEGITTYKYKATLKAPYTAGRYPKTTLRFASLTDGSESIIYVEAIAVPQPIETQQPPKAPNGISDNPNLFDVELLDARLYRITDSRTQVNITCPDGVELESKPDWLTVTYVSDNGAVTLFNLRLNNRDAVVENNQGTVVFHNKKKKELKANVTVTLLDAPVVTSYEAIGPDNTVVPGTPDDTTPDNIVLLIKKDNKVTVKTNSMDGVNVMIDYPEGSPQWLTYSGAATGTNTVTDTRAILPTVMNKVQELTFLPVENKLAGAKTATVTLKNIIGGKDDIFTMTPEMPAPELTKGKEASVPVQDILKAETKAITLYQLPGDNATGSKMQITAASLGGSILAIEGTGATVSPAENTANEANYILKPALSDGTAKATVTLHAKNYTDKEKITDYAVTVLRSDLTGDTKASLTAAANQSVTFKASSHEGFSIDNAAIQWQPDGQTGGVRWFNIRETEVEAGTDKTITAIAVATTTTAQIRPATVTLKNKIADGGDLKVTVTPVYSIPTLAVVDKSASPSQNTLTAGAAASTLKLYRIANSTIKIKATAVGGNKAIDMNGVTVSGGDTYQTENTYTVTLNNKATGGSFKIVNKSDPTKIQTVTVQAPVATITSKNVTLAVNFNQTATAATSSPEGFTASVTNWGGGGAWFDLPTKDFGKNNVNVTVKVNASLGNIGIKPATVTLKNKIAGGGDITFTVTPTLGTPAVKRVSAIPTGNTPATNNATLGNNTTLTLYKLATATNYVLSATCYGGSKAVMSGSGFTLSPNNSVSTNVTQNYTLTATATSGSGSVTIYNADSKNPVTFPVSIKNGVMTLDKSEITLTPANGSAQGLKLTSGAGYKSYSVNWNGGSGWFGLPSSVAGGTNVAFNVTANTANSNPKEATVTLVNAIEGAPNLTNLKVKVGATAPKVTSYSNPSITTATAVSANTGSGTNVELWAVDNSSIQVTIDAIGGSSVYSQTNVNVTGGNTTNQQNTFTITSTNGNQGSFVIANKIAPNLDKLTFTVKKKADAISANNLSVTAALSGATNISVNSNLGCTASVLNNNWGSGGGQWFNFKTADVNGGSKTIQIEQLSTNNNTIMKPVTIRLTSKASGGATKDITVTPTFVAPTLSATSGQVPSQAKNKVFIPNRTIDFTVTPPAGGYTVSSNNTNIATVSQDGHKITVTLKTNSSTTIAVKNASGGQTTNYTVSGGANANLYNGKQVWYYYGYMIAPEDAAGSSTWNTNLTATYCSNKSGATWYVPSADDWRTILQSSGNKIAPNDVYNEYRSKGVFPTNISQYYWSATASNLVYANYMLFDAGSAKVNENPFSFNYQVRCVAK